ncbi:MAG: DUF2911 domain-containing protein [Flavisolibacter sp.]
MKTFFLFIVAAFSCCIAGAQSVASAAASYNLRFAPLDKSPLDVIYFPANYPMLKIQDKVSESPVARLIYSRPQKDDRKIFGDLVPYGEVWRLGANEATELELYRDVTVQGKKLAKGRYSLFAVPEEKSWNIIFNRDCDTWGAFKYDDKKDVMRVKVPVQHNNSSTEAFSASFNKTNSGAELVFAWDDVFAVLPISFR